MATTLAGAHLRCPACGHASPHRTNGMVLWIRAGGSDAPTRVLGRCDGCGKTRFLIRERDDKPTSPLPPPTAR